MSFSYVSLKTLDNVIFLRECDFIGEQQNGYR